MYLAVWNKWRISSLFLFYGKHLRRLVHVEIYPWNTTSIRAKRCLKSVLMIYLNNYFFKYRFFLKPTILLQSQRTVEVYINFSIQNMKIIGLQNKMSISYVFPDFQSCLLYVRWWNQHIIDEIWGNLIAAFKKGSWNLAILIV